MSHPVRLVFLAVAAFLLAVSFLVPSTLLVDRAQVEELAHLTEVDLKIGDVRRFTIEADRCTARALALADAPEHDTKRRRWIDQADEMHEKAADALGELRARFHWEVYSGIGARIDRLLESQAELRKTIFENADSADRAETVPNYERLSGELLTLLDNVALEYTARREQQLQRMRDAARWSNRILIALVVPGFLLALAGLVVAVTAAQPEKRDTPIEAVPAEPGEPEPLEAENVEEVPPSLLEDPEFWEKMKRKRDTC